MPGRAERKQKPSSPGKIYIYIYISLQISGRYTLIYAMKRPLGVVESD